MTIQKDHRPEVIETATCTESSLTDNQFRARYERELDGVYIVVAQIKSRSPEPRYRRHFYASLTNAQKRVENARREGKQADLFLARLEKVVAGPTRQEPTHQPGLWGDLA
ncbi:hypothetical protein QDX25_00785 [Auritidibacter ignavus]|uniref:hypothetical protein n=1 Tax=Auritidibacter ignavus TaxID=678932 RepID=UPI002449924B|nr:hypothetical protein [Auritidibacter ignavus]WGH81752.1 hypothetical protein QDX25_00785 [Auritidibacter ignavus]WHS35212.1 hypothetical protein QM403_01215 [Auritidibacter ignavus]